MTQEDSTPATKQQQTSQLPIKLSCFSTTKFVFDPNTEPSLKIFLEKYICLCAVNVVWCVVCVVCVSGASCLEIFLEQVARKGDTQECRSGARREQNPGISPGASLPGQLASLCLARLYSKAAELSPRPICAFPCKILLLQKLLSQVSQNPPPPSPPLRLSDQVPSATVLPASPSV